MQYVVQFIYLSERIINVVIGAANEVEAKKIYNVYVDQYDKALKSDKIYRINEFYSINPSSIHLIVLAIKEEPKAETPVEIISENP